MQSLPYKRIMKSNVNIAILDIKDASRFYHFDDLSYNFTFNIISAVYIH